MMLKLIYTAFLGILLAFFVGVGISVFYPQPESPEYPERLTYVDKEFTDEQRQIDQEFQEQQRQWEEELEPYNRNVSIIAVVFAIIFLTVGVMYAHKLDVIADGMLLGGIFTMLYGMGRGLASGDEAFRFIVVVVGLIVALGLGYWKFARPTQSVSVKSGRSKES